MIPRFKKDSKIKGQDIKKEEFLEEHNKLSPSNMRATMSLLSHFKADKGSLFRGNSWNLDKLRRPFIIWLTSLKSEEKETISKEEEV